MRKHVELERAPDLKLQLVQRRGAPVVFILDVFSQRVVTSTGYQPLWTEIEGAAKELIDEHRGELARGASASALFNGRCTIRARQLDEPGHYAILVEPFRTRNPMRGATERYFFTPRETEVATLLVDGAGTTEIAEALSIAPSTVVLHVKRIMAKTGSRTRSAMVGRIVRHDDDGHDTVLPSDD